MSQINLGPNIIDANTQIALLTRAQEWLLANRELPQEAQNRIEVTTDVLDNLASGIVDQNHADSDNREGTIEFIKKELTREFDINHRQCSTARGDINPISEWFSSFSAQSQLNFWPAYRQYLLAQGFPEKSVYTIDQDTTKILNHMGNPNDARDKWDYRGMVIGHVQSGKTASFIGLIDKAADAGYKLIIVFTGVLESLRMQTQQRIDAGFRGASLNEMGVTVPDGIAPYFNGDDLTNLSPISQTKPSEKGDFSGEIGMPAYDLGQVNRSVYMVCKKEKHALDNIITWLTNQVEHLGRFPVLVIDDECDNASVNTAAANEDPTSLNGKIRDVLEICPKSSYVGFTATPFANIFIDHDPDNNHNQDLFPRDFITTINAPDNYVGYQRLFLSPNEDRPDTSHYGNLSECIKSIPEAEDFPLKHPNAPVEALPVTLKEAIHNFIITLAIKKKLGLQRKNSTMMIHASRFTAVQESLNICVYNYLEYELLVDLIANCGLNENEALENSTMRAIKSVYDQEYAHSNFASWPEIQNSLAEVCGQIKTEAYYTRSKNKVNYPSESNDPQSIGKKVIGIGGPSVARGITLEGLVVSYFYRVSKTYDTMTQMARWFGYRTGFEKLCRVYMTAEALNFFRFIGIATDELREEVERMDELTQRPVDFGLKVRSHYAAGFTITGRYKMRRAENQTASVDLGGKMMETIELNTKLPTLSKNRKAIFDLYNEQKIDEEETTYGWGVRNVDINKLITFIEDFEYMHDSLGHRKNQPLVKEYLKIALATHVWTEFNMILRRPQNSEQTPSPINGHSLILEDHHYFKRKTSIKEGALVDTLRAENRRIGNETDEFYALNLTDPKYYKKPIKNNHGEVRMVKDKDKIRKEPGRLPLLAITPFDWTNPENNEDYRPGNFSFSIIFPYADGLATNLEYMVNTVYTEADLRAEEQEDIDQNEELLVD